MENPDYPIGRAEIREGPATDNDPLPTSHRLAGGLETVAVVAVDEGMTPRLVLISAHVASIDATKHVTAIKPAYFEPRLPPARGFS
jgi:hypothetical protein